MKFNLLNPVEQKAAKNRLRYLVGKGRIVNITQVMHKRTLAQNAYLHLLIGAFAAHFGYTLEEGKQLYKEINSGIFYYRKKNRLFLRSSADLNKEEMAKSIDTFREKSAEQGCELPLATDEGWLIEIENEIERNRRYL